MTDGLKDAHREAIIAALAANDRVERAVLFGSRATGTNTVTSDVDIALFGDRLTLTDQARLATAIDEIPMAQTVDLILYDSIQDRALREHIRNHGVEWFEREHVADTRATGEAAIRSASLADIVDPTLSSVDKKSKPREEPDMRWPSSPLGSLVSVHNEKITPSSFPKRLFAHHSIPAFDDGQSPVLESGSAIKSNKFTVPSNVVLVSRLNPRFPRVWAPDVCGDLPAICSTEFLVLRPRSIDRRFLHHLCMSPSFRASLLERVTGTSGSHQRVAPMSALEIEVAVPTVSEQRTIAHVLGTLDDKIELNRRMNETLEAMARALFKSWFVDFDPVRAKMEGRDTCLPQDIAELFPDRLVDSEMGKIPGGWRLGMLREVLRRRVAPCRRSDQTASRPYVPISCIPRRSLSLIDSEPGKNAKSSLTRFYDGDILFGAMRPYFHKVCIAPFDGTTRTTAFVLYPQHDDGFSFSALQLHRPSTIDFATRHARGSTIPYATWEDSMALMPITVPPPRVLRAFDDLVRPALTRISRQYFESRTLAALRDTLLPQLISGELPVHSVEKLLGKAQ